MQDRAYILCVVLLWSFVLPLEDGTAQERLLVRNGASAYQIVLQAEASPSEETAADELQQHFQQCTGVVLPIVTGTPTDDSPTIVLGTGPAAEALGVAPSAADLGE